MTVSPRTVVAPGGIARMLDQNPQPTPKLQAAIDHRKDTSMTTNQDRAAQIINAAHIETLVGLFSADGSQFTMKDVVDHLQALLPDPQPRTLKDMTPEEREACQWMQADYLDKDTGRTTRIIITRADQHVTDVVFPSGVVSCVYNDELTILPDLPRMVWPEEQAPEEDMSIIPPKIDTSTGHDDSVDMTPEEVPAGEAWLIEVGGQRVAGIKSGVGFGYRDVVRTWAPNHMVTLVSRLVPEVKA